MHSTIKSAMALPVLAALARAQDLCGQYDYQENGGYYVNNNAWGQDSATGGSQCTHIDTMDSNGVTWYSEWSWSGGDTEVKSYPYSGVTIDSPMLVSDISDMPTKAEWAYSSGSDLKVDVAYDLFTAADPAHETSSGDYELMIWLAARGGATPIGGTPTDSGVTIGNTTWDLYFGPNGDMQVYSFLSNQEIPTFEQDVKPFYQYLIDNHGFPADSQYLITFQFGTEPFTGTDARFDTFYWYGQIN